MDLDVYKNFTAISMGHMWLMPMSCIIRMNISICGEQFIFSSLL